LGNLGVDRRIKWIIKKWVGEVLTDLAEDRDRWRALLKAVLNPWDSQYLWTFLPRWIMLAYHEGFFSVEIVTYLDS